RNRQLELAGLQVAKQLLGVVAEPGHVVEDEVAAHRLTGPHQLLPDDDGRLAAGRPEDDAGAAGPQG
nr:hypothetical protein [Tanacetum cinerariifolium]